ncbi:hypothetical protein DV738_g4492, partial [Chaetothyriales sp. CBS 135597]
MPSPAAPPSSPDPKFPLFQLVVLAICRLSEPISFTSVLAYIYVYTKDIRHTSENAAFYSGLLVSGFAVAEVLTAYHWGLLSDKIGRKPVVLFALIGTAASNLVFGFATNYWVALASRFLGGLLNGNVAVMQTMVAEMCKKPEHEPKAYSMIPFVWSAGSILGAAMGGFLARPSESWPSIFPENGLFGQFPYLLPNLVAVVFLLLAVIQGIFLLEETNEKAISLFRWSKTPSASAPERTPLLRENEAAPPAPTTPQASNGRRRSSIIPAEPVTFGTSVDLRRLSSTTTRDDKPIITITGIESSAVDDSGDEESSFRYSWEMVLLIIQLILMAYHSMAYASILPTFLVDEPRTKGLDLQGGLGYTVRDVGGYMAVQSVIAMFVQLLIFPFFVERVGIWKSFVWLTVFCPIAYIVVPFLTALSHEALPYGIYADMLVQNFFVIILYPCVLILLKDATPSLSIRTMDKDKRYSETKIFLCNIPYSLYPEDLVQLFATINLVVPVSDIDICLDGDGNSRGFAFVELHDPAKATFAIEALDGYILLGRCLELRKAFYTLRDRPSHGKARKIRTEPSTIESARPPRAKKQTAPRKLRKPILELDSPSKMQNDKSNKKNDEADERNNEGNKRGNENEGSKEKLLEMWVSYHRNDDRAPTCTMAEPPRTSEDADGFPSGFPKSPSQFDTDPRISFSRLDNKFLLETEEGTEYEWDTSLKRWIPVLDQELLDQQAAIYKVEGVEDEDADASATTITTGGGPNKKKRKKNGDEGNQKPKKPRTNTAVYVTSIPLDATRSEIQSVFSKCGMIAEEIDSGQPRIKMYEDEKGAFKGDALVVYFRPESVQLAVQMLDDSDFRLGESRPAERMRVQAADFSYKSQQEVPEKKSKGEQRKIIKKTQKMNSKLADWDDDDDPRVVGQPSSQWDKVVILKHIFTLEELEEDPSAMLEIKEDIRDECSKLGEVTNVVLFDKEAEGVASVRFTRPEVAEACVRVMNGRWFNGSQVEAFVATGNEKFKRTNGKSGDLDEEKSEEGRLDKFGAWLEEGGLS